MSLSIFRETQEQLTEIIIRDIKQQKELPRDIVNTPDFRTVIQGHFNDVGRTLSLSPPPPPTSRSSLSFFAPPLHYFILVN
jgi:hypothetical protein